MIRPKLGRAAVLFAATWLAGCTAPDAVESAGASRAADALAVGFADPPKTARPRTWWHWMNGNITQEGIARDLAWFDRVGLGGFQNFDANLETPQIVENRLVYMTPQWREALRFAAAEAARLDLEMAIAASPGWSETGGPWVPPEDGMKKLVWSETVIAGGVPFRGVLRPAPSNTGAYQTTGVNDFAALINGTDGLALPNASGEIAVIAVPLTVPPLPAPVALAGGTAADAGLLTDDDRMHGVAVPVAQDGVTGELELTYPEPVTIRSAQIFLPGARPPFGDTAVLPALEAYLGGSWREVAELELDRIPITHSFAPVTARKFRLRLGPNIHASNPSLGSPAPGAESMELFPVAKSDHLTVADLRLSGEVRLDHAEAKAGFETVPDYLAIMSDEIAPAGIAPDRVIDLTDRLQADGSLEWTPPAGSDWRIYRFGWSLTGKVNHPASPEATGLEVDKFDAAAVRRYLQTYLEMYRDTVGDGLMGETGLRALLTDSIEVGPANWTGAMEPEFEARRGYALRPWLPALAGAVIGSEAQTEKFLFDFRGVLAELIEEKHYGTVAEVAHENGLIVYGEALEAPRPVLGSDLAMRRAADVPMAALWTWGAEGPRTSLLGDMKGAASVAHVYGRTYVAAESMTSANSPWAFAPRDLKPVIDLEFAMGINRPVIHTSVHVPVEDRKPGLSLAIFGQYFNRNETWAEMARPWIDYIARTGYLLQQGRNFADVAVFMGEDAPLTALYATSVPDGLPKGYAFDFVDARMLDEALAVEDGLVTSVGGARYRAIFLSGSSAHMTLPTLRRLSELVDEGATLIGRKPVRSPSLADSAAEFAALADELWSDPRVIASTDVERALAGLGLEPDFTFAGPGGEEVLFVHRTAAESEIYFVNNRADRAVPGEARFRVKGKAPELWDAISGKSRPVSYRIDGDVTVVPLELGPLDAKFVVFRGTTQAGSAAYPIAEPSVAAQLDRPWQVSFQPGRGAPPGAVTMAQLTPLDRHSEPGIRYFSGVASYTTTFELPGGATPGEPLWIDLGQVGDVAEIWVNGEPVGTTWFAPYRLNIGGHVVRGENEVEIRVANLWVNRLIGDRQPGAERVTFTAAPTYRPDAPLRASGLIGPVRLLAGN